MRHLAIFSATLGLSPPWHVTAVEFDRSSNRVDIKVEFRHGSALVCPACGEAETGEWQTETWYREDFFNYSAYLHAEMPCVSCRCGALSLERPWCRAGSRFSLVPERKWDGADRSLNVGISRFKGPEAHQLARRTADMERRLLLKDGFC